jgi:hypothetical protein
MQQSRPKPVRTPSRPSKRASKKPVAAPRTTAASEKARMGINRIVVTDGKISAKR